LTSISDKGNLIHLRPFSCSSSHDVHKKDHHHKEVDDEAKSKDVIPLGGGDDLFNHASVVALGMSSLNQEVGVSIAGGTLIVVGSSASTT